MNLSRFKPGALWAAVLAAMTIWGLQGCAGMQSANHPVIQPAPAAGTSVPNSAIRAPETTEGSLWRSDVQFNSLFIDTKARKVGDIVTVRIEEAAQATNKATTTTGRDSSLEAGIDKLFGLEKWYRDTVLTNLGTDFPKPDPFGNPSVKGSMKSDFKGEGETSRSGKLTAFITCRVVEVLPNGNLKIVGSREVLVNNENQLIILSGVIRPRDIADDNIIRSTFISDAKIAYSGDGIIDQRQRPGWLADLLNTLWPF